MRPKQTFPLSARHSFCAHRVAERLGKRGGQIVRRDAPGAFQFYDSLPAKVFLQKGRGGTANILGGDHRDGSIEGLQKAMDRAAGRGSDIPCCVLHEPCGPQVDHRHGEAREGLFHEPQGIEDVGLRSVGADGRQRHDLARSRALKRGAQRLDQPSGFGKPGCRIELWRQQYEHTVRAAEGCDERIAIRQLRHRHVGAALLPRSALVPIPHDRANPLACGEQALGQRVSHLSRDAGNCVHVVSPRSVSPFAGLRPLSRRAIHASIALL